MAVPRSGVVRGGGMVRLMFVLGGRCAWSKERKGSPRPLPMHSTAQLSTAQRGTHVTRPGTFLAYPSPALTLTFPPTNRAHVVAVPAAICTHGIRCWLRQGPKPCSLPHPLYTGKAPMALPNGEHAALSLGVPPAAQAHPSQSQCRASAASHTCCLPLRKSRRTSSQHMPVV